MDLQSTAQLGDTIGGISNAITLIAVVVGALYARKEVRRGRELHAYATRAESAKEIWRATVGLGRACGAFVETMNQKMPLQAFQGAFDSVAPAHARLCDTVADAALFFSHDVFVIVDGMNRTFDGFLVALKGVTNQNYVTFELEPVCQAYDQMRAAQGQVFSVLGRAVHADDFSEWEKTMSATLAATRSSGG